MTNFEKYQKTFLAAFELDLDSESLEALEYQSIPEWDSVGHMGLIAELEDAFELMLEMDDIIDFSSFTKGLEILRKNGVDI